VVLRARPPGAARDHGYHITALADGGLSVSSIGRRLAAIAYAHRLGREANPCTGSDDLRELLAGVRRTLGVAPKKKAAATADLVRRMLEACDISTVLGLRDRALLAIGFAGALRRSELVALRIEDLTWVDDGVRILLRRSKTDQAGAGQEIVIPRGLKIRPVAALEAWLEAAKITEGLLFRCVRKGGAVRPQPLRGIDVARVVQRYATCIGLDASQYAGHSLRSGFCTSAAESGANIWKIADQSRQKSLDTLRGYVRAVDAFKDHAGSSFLVLALTFTLSLLGGVFA